MDKNKEKEGLEKTLQDMTPFWDMNKECSEIRTKAQTYICDIVGCFGKGVGKNTMRFTFKNKERPLLTLLENDGKRNTLRTVLVSDVEIRNRTENSLGSMTLYEGKKVCNGTLLSTETWLFLYGCLRIAVSKMLEKRHVSAS